MTHSGLRWSQLTCNLISWRPGYCCKFFWKHQTCTRLPPGFAFIYTVANFWLWNIIMYTEQFHPIQWSKEYIFIYKVILTNGLISGQNFVRVSPISALLLCFLTFLDRVGVLILYKCKFYRGKLTRRQSIKTKKKRFESCNLSSHNFEIPTLDNADFAKMYCLNFFLRDFSVVAVLEHSKFMQLFNNIPSTNTGEGQ